MADIFISYSQKDRERVAPLVTALTAEGYDVWWDLRIRAGESFDELIEGTLERVSCVVGVWSKHSVKSEWVRAECAWAKDQRIFVSLRIDDDARLPLKFYNVHTPSLAGWDGSRTAAAYHSLLCDIQALAGVPAHNETVTKQRDRPMGVTRTGELVESHPGHAAREFVVGSRFDYDQRTELTRFRDPLRDDGEGPEMLVLPAGRFWMGSPKNEQRADGEGPRHQVAIPRAFALGVTPVTFADYGRFVEATGSEKPYDEGWGRGTRPVINVSWKDAVAYASWLTEQTGKSYRLPSEAEWEYACRAGTGTQWSFGDERSELGAYAWYAGNANNQTHPVGEKPPNPWGLCDMHGNVWEWVEDCWHGDYKGAPTDGSAWLEADGGKCGRRVLRGGSWSANPGLLRSANRLGDYADCRFWVIGFRLARDL